MDNSKKPIAKSLSKKHFLFILLLAWLIIQSLFLKIFGIVTTLEATKYIEECQNLLKHGTFSDNKYLFYSVYVFIHIIFYKMGVEVVGVYIFQLSLNLIATYSFYQFNYKITGKDSVAFIAVLLLLLTQTFQMWTVYLYTESVYSSLIILFAYCLFVLNQEKIKNQSLAAFIFILIIFSRPTGLLLIPVLGLYSFFLLIQKRKYLKAFLLASSVSIGFFLLLNYAMHSSPSFDFMKPFFENEVLCYIPTENTLPLTTHTNSNSLLNILEYILHNKRQFIHLSYEKFISFWGMQRYYDSTSHNLYFVFFFYPIYFFTLIGLFRLYKQQKQIFLFIVTLFLIFTLGVILSCDDWNNRFNIPIIPFIMISGAIGIDTFLERLKVTMKNIKHKQKNS